MHPRDLSLIGIALMIGSYAVLVVLISFDNDLYRYMAAPFLAGLILWASGTSMDQGRPVLDDGRDRTDANRWFSMDHEWSKPAERAPDSDNE